MLSGGRNRSRSRSNSRQGREERDNNDAGNGYSHDPLELRPTMSFVDENKRDEAAGSSQHTMQQGDSTEHNEFHGPHNGLIYSAPTTDTLESTPHPYTPTQVGQQQPRSTSFSHQHHLPHPSSTTSRSATPLRGSLSSSMPPHAPRTPERTPRKQLQNQQPPRSGNRSRASPLLHRSTVPSSPLRSRSSNPQVIASTPSSVNTSRGGRKNKKTPKRKTRNPQTHKSDKQFQHDNDCMSVSVRTIPVAERVAFDKHRLISMEEWRSIATELSGGGGVANASSAPPLSSLRRAKLSPSLQQLQLLHKLQSITQIRQLAFTPSVGLASDVLFVPSGRDDDCYDYPRHAVHDPNSNQNVKRRKSRKGDGNTYNRDGRYRSIDPVVATVAALPPTPPLLSNKKHRLPLRSDVGFPNASAEEIQQKQAEISNETEWEEASPRLIVLVTSDDLGTAVQEEPKRLGSGGVGAGGRPQVALSELTKPLYGGGLEGMPWAGPELQIAKSRNHRHFSRSADENGGKSQQVLQRQRTSYDGGSVSTTRMKNTTKEEDDYDIRSSQSRHGGRQSPYSAPPPNRYSMLAPPLDATFSNTLGWRPRPFHDRPPDMAYALCCPVQLDFDAGNLEPLLCSLTLYTLPSPTSSTKKSQAPYGKMSEEFWFPAGDWKGRVDTKSLVSSQAEEQSIDSLEAWHRRTHKGIFAYRRNDLGVDSGGGREQLFVVLQVYKVTHVDGAAAYLAQTASDVNSSNAKKNQSLRLRLQNKFKKRGVEKTDLLDADIAAHRTNYRANFVYDNFGTQFMSPLCFGLARLFPSFSLHDSLTTSSGIADSIRWPQGETQRLQLYSFPDCSESQEDFCERLVSVAHNIHTCVGEPISTMEQSLGALYTMQGDDLPGTSLSHSYSSVSSVSSTTSANTLTTNPSDLSSSSKYKGVRRLLNPRRPSSRKDLVGSSSHSKERPQVTNQPMTAKARLFTSALDVDFLQSMLFAPPEIEHSLNDGGIRNTPTGNQLAKVLVDVSGDSAIMVDPRKELGPNGNTTTTSTTAYEGAGSQTRKRSSLIRLPALSRPAGYLGAAEFREVLCLPPRPEKNYDSVDLTPSYRTLLNLLYLYPKLLRLDDSQIATSESHNRSNRRGEKSGERQRQQSKPRYTVRLRLVQSSVGLDKDSGMLESTNNVLDLFHNPAPWAGSPLLSAVYTKIPCDTAAPSSGGHDGKNCSPRVDDVRVGIPMRDEFKLRLPMILDGSYFLHFSLFSVDVSDDLGGDDSTSGGSRSEAGDGGCGISLQPLAETTIPLSSSSTRDSVSGIKATTVIPNGIHRLKVGEFQLQLETRLVSSIHVSDPAVATALRDFPFVAGDDINRLAMPSVGGERLRELVLMTRPSSSRGDKTATPVPEKIPYSTLFSKASGSALIGHFQEFFYMHLSNLIVAGGPNVDVSGRFLVENMQSLLEICRRIKHSLLCTGDGQDMVGRRRLEAFIKSSIDAFDEGLLHAVDGEKQDASDDDAASEALQETRPDASRSESADDDQNIDFDGGAVRRRNRDSIRSGIDLRISRTFSAMEASGIPFARVAYGASKTDRMRLEAELENDTSRFTYLVDDDETVVTTATGLFSMNEPSMADAREAFTEKMKGATSQKEADEPTRGMQDFQNDVIESDGGAPSSSHLPDLRDWQAYSRSIGELGLAKRVRHAAHVMLSPCVAPNVSTLFQTRNSSPYSVAKQEVHVSQSDEEKAGTRRHDHELSQSTCLPLPEFDEEEAVGTEGKDDQSEIDSTYQTNEGTFRPPTHCPILNFSIQPDRSHKRYEVPLARGEFLYESILVLWLRAWVDHAEKHSKEQGTTALNMHQSFPAFAIPEFDMESTIDNPMYSFHAHMDVILPLCLKSIVLRCTRALRPLRSRAAKAVVDDGHMAILEPFVEMVTRGLIGEAMGSSPDTERERGLVRAMYSADIILDFLVGLFAVLHPAHLAALVTKYFTTLRDCETEQLETNERQLAFVWTEESLHRVHCTRQLRIRAVEKLSALPNFLALNYPIKHSAHTASTKPSRATWRTQYCETNQEGHSKSEPLQGDVETLLPPSGWLADLLTTESLSICALSCEAVVAEAMAHIQTQHDSLMTSSSKVSSLKKRPTASLKRSDLLMFQSIAIHAITCVHELLLRRHAMDMRFQRESSRGRIAALFMKPIFEKSLASVRWLARMESTHKVRSLWLLCFAYVLQEAPETLIRQTMQSYCDPRDVRIHRFIRLLRLSSSTFQCFVDQPRHSMFPSEIDIGISPWLMQESFNTICATTIVVVEESARLSSISPREQKKMVHGILDLLLHVLTTPQSCVTHLRAVGGAIQALEKFGTSMFLEIAGGSLQHWIRVMLSLMNSIALSVRSIAVDFVVSLLGSTFDLMGNMDELALIFATVLPEVVAREIGLNSVSGHIASLEGVEKSVWPLRRSFADIEDANPLDDDRVDPQLSPLLSVFCRACQAVIDGVLIEMRLQGDGCVIVGARLQARPIQTYTFDADEESLFEAASFFVPETAPMQRIRWLLTLKSLHEAKGQWVEAAETLIMCARTISDSIPHLRNVWRPSQFVLWSDSRRSLWLSTVGEDMGNPERGNEQVMSFADNFLEPSDMVDSEGKTSTGRLTQPTVSAMCAKLTAIVKEAVSFYQREDGMDELAYERLESLLKSLMGILDDHGTIYHGGGNGSSRLGGLMGKKRYVEDEAALRRVLASLSGDMTKLAEQLLLIVQDEPISPTSGKVLNRRLSSSARRPYYVRVLMSGKKPGRFQESTTLPTFLEWGTPCINRVPTNIVASSISKTSDNENELEAMMCAEFGKPIRDAILAADANAVITFRAGNNGLQAPEPSESPSTCIDISFVSSLDRNARDDSTLWSQSKHFFYRKPNTSPTAASDPSSPSPDGLASIVELTVARSFPCALSRQRSLLTSEFHSMK